MDAERQVTPEEQIRRESELAKQLLDANDHDRRRLYGAVYDEIVSMHLSRKGRTAREQTRGARPGMLGRLVRLSSPGADVIEIGCGTGFLSLELAAAGRRVVGVDVSAVGIDVARAHGEALGTATPNLRFETIEGLGLPFPDESFDLAFSVEVLEHLHERDVPGHLAEVLRVLRPGGTYCLWTPNRLDSISVHDRFAVEAGGEGTVDVHLKEWTFSELRVALLEAGFERVRTPWRDVRLHWVPPLPVSSKIAAQRLASRSPRSFRRLLVVGAGLAGCTVIGARPQT